jgi:hypothetical protein
LNDADIDVRRVGGAAESRRPRPQARHLLLDLEMRFVDRDDFAAHVAAHLGATTLDLTRACDVVLAAFAGWLSPANREFFVREFPSSFSITFEHATREELPLEERLVLLGLTIGHAREVIASVCHVLGETLTDDTLVLLHDALPEWLAAFAVRPAPGPTVPVSRAARRSDTLAEGRPGSHAPVSEARADRRQQASVAADNPHGDAKLSSTTGTTQEREHETLADGPTPTHPIATSRS